MRKRFAAIFLYLLVSAFSFAGFAQVPQGKFLKDSVKIGEEIPYSLSFSYPKNWQVLFPDSTSNFAPFEYSRRIYFPTKSDSLYSRDSTLYYLSTFELDSVQSLRLPVRIKIGSDTTTIYTEFSSIILSPTVTQIPDSLAFLENTLWRKVSKRFNYPYLVAGLVLFLVLLIIGWIAFGKRIQRWFRLKKLRARFQTFMDKFTRGLENLNSVDMVEHQLFLWKNYIEELENKPYTKLTTREILVLIDESGFDKVLKEIDRFIYAGKQEGDLKIPFERLQEFAIRKFKEKETELSHD